jgi:hypothetical protein
MVKHRPATARRSGPREHGRQASRSKRDRPERTSKQRDELSHVRVAVGGVPDSP